MTDVSAGPAGLESIERQLDRVQAFFPRIDTKVSALFAIASGEIAVAALNLSADDFGKWWIAVPACLFIVCVAWCFLHLYRCAYPNLNGGQNSLIYFSEIAKLREADYISRFLVLSREDLSKDITGQIWRNSCIVSQKFLHLKTATASLMLSVVPWTMLLAATSLSSGRLPVLP